MKKQLPLPKAPVRTEQDIVESPSVTALMRHLLSTASGREKNPDHLGHIFVNGKWTNYLMDPDYSIKYFNKKLPGILYYHLIRTKHFDGSFTKWIKENHDSQVVILGTGYDSRSIRFKDEIEKNNIKIFEVDLKALLQFKQKLISEKLNITLGNVVYVPCNFQSDDVIDKLLQYNFDVNKPTFVLCEGLTFFLTEENNRHYLQLFKNNTKNLLQIMFDYDMRDFVEGNHDYYGGKELYELTTDALGEPHLFGLNYEEVEPFAITNGFKLKSNYTSFMLESLYLRDHFGKSVGTPHGFNAMAEIIREV